MLQREDRLDEPGRARRRLGVSDLRLHRADRAPLAVFASGLLEDRAQPLELGRVARDGAGAVRLDELHAVGSIAGGLVRATDRLRLALRDGRVDRGALAVAARAHAADDRVDPVSVTLRLVEALERDHAEALAQHRAVGLIAERAAVPALAQRGRLAEAEEHEDVVHRVRAAADHDVRLPRGELVDGHRERAEGARAGRVGDAVRPAEVQAVGDAPRDHVAEHAREGRLLPRRVVRLDALARLLDLGLGHAHLAERLGPHRPLEPAVHLTEQLLRAGHAEHHAHALAVLVAELAARRVLEHALRDDEREELTGVGGGHGRRRHPPRHRVEVDLGHERAAAGVGLVRRGRVGVEVVLDQPVGRGHVRDAVGAGEDVLPEARRVERAREERAHADDGDGGMSLGHGSYASGRGSKRKAAAGIGAP